MKRFGLALIAAAALALPAQAADMRLVTKAPPLAGPVYDWSGFYAGAHLGVGWNDTSWNFPVAGIAASNTSTGFLGGGQAGLNYQIGTWVIGIEGDVSWTGANGSTPCGLSNCQSNLDWMSTVTGRLGYSWGPGMIYGKGGAAWAHNDYTIGAGTFPAGTASETKNGWVAGLGLEFMLGRNWSAKAEYNYVDLGTSTPTVSSGTALNVDQKIQAVKVGVNYRFNWDGPVGR